MDWRIRELRPDDATKVIAMSDRLTEGVAAWRDAAAVSRSVRSWLEGATAPDSDARALVAVNDDGAVVGFVSLSTTTHFAGEVDGYIGELVVDRQHEGAGIGAGLVRAAEALAREQGHRCLTLTTGAANRRAIDFYERLGFQAEDVKLTKLLDD